MKMVNIERATFVLLVAGVAFFLLAFVGLGLTPWAQVDRQDVTKAPKQLVPLTALQIQGRKLYMQNGCDYCHSQFVRPVGDDPLRYGPVSKTWEYSQQYPHLFGTRRIGPDLTREGGVHSNDWQYVHLYDPRLIVPWSIMPSFPWLFKGSPGKPSRQAKALVAYLQTLGQAREKHMLADGNAHKQFIAGIGTVVEYKYHGGKLSDPGYDKVIYFQKAQAPENTPELRARGASLYHAECMQCHGAEGRGTGPAAKYLQPTPVRLAAFRFNKHFLYKVLYFGRPGSAMPSWVHAFDGFLSPRDLWAIADYLTSAHFYEGDRGITQSQAPQAPKKTGALLTLGEKTFKASCFACHGMQGGGDGPAAKALSPAPVDFQGMQPSVRWAFHIITKGRPGTAMSGFASMPAKKRWALAYYVDSLFKAGTTAKTARTGGDRGSDAQASAAAGNPNVAGRHQGAS